ncbi:MAG TPA: hypothetical protein PKC65_09425 [Pyrinomonadaceae bacterium]|nr:hypothetical protein [Pyrinomonadaceae bacterium]
MIDLNSTRGRDEVSKLAKIDVAKATKIAEKITEPWFQARAWSYLIRYADDPLLFLPRAAKAASKGKDEYQRSAVRAWEIAALGERGNKYQARQTLHQAVELAASIPQASSQAEALILLFQAAFKISAKDAEFVAHVLLDTCRSDHWRAVRA